MERDNKEDKTIYHISHLHPLKLKSINTSSKTKSVCNACRHPCNDGIVYECTRCDYALDSCCAHFPSTITHRAHKCPRSLVLNLMPPYSTGAFRCNACGHDGVSFCFHCSDCDFDLHLPCAALPETLRHRSHPHPLTLVFSDSNIVTNYICDLCNKQFSGSSQWMYICRPCDFGGHVSCFMSSEMPGSQQNGNSREGNTAAELMEMQRKLQQTMIAADLSVRGSRAAVNLVGSGPTYRYYDAGPLPSQYAAMANNIVMSNFALASLNNDTAGNAPATGGVSGGNVARANGGT